MLDRLNINNACHEGFETTRANRVLESVQTCWMLQQLINLCQPSRGVLCSVLIGLCNPFRPVYIKTQFKQIWHPPAISERLVCGGDWSLQSDETCFNTMINSFRHFQQWGKFLTSQFVQSVWKFLTMSGPTQHQWNMGMSKNGAYSTQQLCFYGEDHDKPLEFLGHPTFRQTPI